MIAVGNINASKVYLGSEEISKIYLGSTQIWGGSSPTPVPPYDAEVEYLESTGTQYIDTGIPATYELTEIETEILFTDSQSLSRFFATYYVLSNSAPRCYLLERTVTPGIRTTNQTDPSFSASKAIVKDLSDGVFSVIKSSISQSQMELQGTTLNNSVSGADGHLNYYMFCLNSNGSAASFTKAKCKYCKVRKNGVLVRDYIPVRNGTTGYMYDRVSGTLFGNAGTGSFVFGNDVTT